jgi:hypothetical protein
MPKNTNQRPRDTRPVAPKVDSSKGTIQAAKIITRDDLRRDTYSTRESGPAVRSG